MSSTSNELKVSLKDAKEKYTHIYIYIYINYIYIYTREARLRNLGRR
jgi:hypothetical protein